MRIEKTEVYGFTASLRAMRNPKDSWDRSDSISNVNYYLGSNGTQENFLVGELDKKLSQQLTKAGSEHCKHLRMIQVWSDLTLPRYIWSEFDTYKHIEKISCSTMHKLMSHDLTQDMFQGGYDYIPEDLISTIQHIIDLYRLETDLTQKKLLKLRAKRLLPESFLQKRTITTNYQQLLNIYLQRRNHELPEWKLICEWILNLPYFVELTGMVKLTDT